MHELGLTRNIVAIVAEHAGERPVKRVQVAVGARACVEKQALAFCFDLVARGTVLEGDQMTANDAERIGKAGARAIQVNTGAECHLEADMVGAAARALDPEPGALLMIENVGNLVCPAMFDLGERMKVVVISTTEGEDKPLKYPHMFGAAELVLINKIDLAVHVDFDEDMCRANIGAVNPDAKILALSAKTGEGMSARYRVCL